jgi:osmoprotectant transport system ATP-binding protein
MLVLRQVTKSYGHQRVVDRVDLPFDRGKTTVLIGPSGCGKSTLLRLLIGLIPPDQGVIELDGVPLPSLPLVKLRQRFGYVMQSGGLFPHLTVRENIILPADFHRWPVERIASRVEDLITLARLPADLLDRYPAQISGGQRQRVSLMRALMLDPDVLLFDEPLGALDPMIRSQLQTELQGLFRSLGKTVVFVTHDLHEAAFFADDMVLLRQGRIEQSGTPHSFIEHPANAFVKEFLSAQQNHLLLSNLTA